MTMAESMGQAGGHAGPSAARAASGSREGLSLFAMLRALRAAAPTILELFHIRAELARVEWEQEKMRLARMAVATGVAVLSTLLCLLFACIALIVGFWDSEYRTLVAVLIPVAFGIAAVGGYAVVRRQQRLAEHRFAGTREEWSKDLAWLKARI